jgi:hypothetical protein
VKACLLGGTTAIVVGFLATTSQSLWIDEANSAIKAMAPTLAAFVESMKSDRGSDLQMPLYMYMLWGWEKVAGHSEFALRAMNIPLFGLAIAVSAGGWRTTVTRRIFFVALACSSAFLWAYIDETRPYILQFLGATICAISLANTASSATPPQNRDIALFAFGLVVLCGSSLMGVVSAFWLSLAFLLISLQRQRLGSLLRRPAVRTAALLAMPALVLLGIYYVWTLTVGARASSVGQTGPLSLGFAAYELLGMAGLGPGRGELRSSWQAILPFTPMLAVFGIALGLLLCIGGITIAQRKGPFTANPSLSILIAAPVAIALSSMLIGVFGHFRVVGRHLTPLAPFLILIMAVGADSLWHARHRFSGRAIVCLALLSMLSSALLHRMDERHAKDDYRSAASRAHETLTQGGTVWWAADRSGAQYYHLETCLLPESNVSFEEQPSAYMANSRSADYLAQLPKPSLVVLSKVDVYDSDGHLRKWLDYNGFASTSYASGFEFYRYLNVIP